MANYLEGGWILSGTHPNGEAVSLRLSDGDLLAAELGITIGRHPELCDHTIAEPSVSRRHFRVSFRAGGLSIEDLNSLNGTVIDGKDIPAFVQCPLEAGQRLVLGRLELKLARMSD